MRAAKVAVVGAGSMSFGLAVLKGLLMIPGLDGITLHLHDIAPDAVLRMGDLGRYLAGQWQLATRVEAGTDLEEALTGADVVIISVAQNREEEWQQDVALGRRLKIRHYGENGGPGALFHAARSIGLVLPVARAMERLCPRAWLVNYTNPLPRVNTAVSRYTSVRNLGVCHQVEFGYYLAGVLLADEIGLELPDDYRFLWTDEHIARHDEISRLAKEQIYIQASGLNHFTWAQWVGWRQHREADAAKNPPDGPLYAALRNNVKRPRVDFEPFSRVLFELFGLLPTPGDTHLVEYLPYTHNEARGTWDRYAIQMYDFEWSRRRRVQQVDLARRIIEQKELALLDEVHSERAEQITEGLLTGNLYVDEALNMTHHGALPGLPHEAIVEMPVTFLPSGPEPVRCPPLPLAIQEILRRQVAITELAVKGIVEKDRNSLRQALALDPMVDDPELPDALLEAAVGQGVIRDSLGK